MDQMDYMDCMDEMDNKKPSFSPYKSISSILSHIIDNLKLLIYNYNRDILLRLFMNAPLSNDSHVKNYNYTPTSEIKNQGIEDGKAKYQQSISYNGRNYTLTVKMDANATQEQVEQAFVTAREKTAALAVAYRLGKPDKDGKFGATSIKLLSNNRVQISGNSKTSILDSNAITRKIETKMAKLQEKDHIKDPSKRNLDAQVRQKQWDAKHERLADGLKLFSSNSNEPKVEPGTKSPQKPKETSIEMHLEPEVPKNEAPKIKPNFQHLIDEKKNELSELNKKLSILKSEIQNIDVEDSEDALLKKESLLKELNELNGKIGEKNNELNKLISEHHAKKSDESLLQRDVEGKLIPPPSINTPKTS